jgi:HEAT repeat protein
LLAPACSGSAEDPDRTPEAATAEQAIAAFDDSQAALAASIAAVTESALADPDAMRAASMEALGAAGPAERFAAVYGLTLSASTDDPASLDALRELAGSDDVTERLLAAGALAALGERDGVATMIDSLTSEEQLRNVDPPMPAWRYARANLLLIVGHDLGLRDASDLDAATAAADAWSSWWAENAEALTWNPQLGRFEGGAA